MIRKYFDTFKVTRRASKNINHLKKLNIDTNQVNRDVVKSWSSYKNVVAQDLLNNMSVERLNDVETGMPISILQTYGINYVSDCVGKSQQYFQRFPGIGEVKSRRIVVGTDLLKNAVTDEIDFRIKENSQSEELLKTLHNKLNFINNEKEIVQFNKDKIETINISKKKRSSAYKRLFILPWLLSQNKENIDNDIEELSQIDSKPLINKYEDLTIYDKPAKYQDDFDKRSISYYSALEKSLKLKLDFEETYLSDDLIKKVENTKLNIDKLEVSPRGYQYFGAQYMISQKKTLIGDEMGLGKTIEALVAMNHLHQEEGANHFVVIAPLSVLTNWKRETNKWTTLKTYVFHGNGRKNQFSLWLEFGGVLITTYGHAGLLKINKEFKIDMLVVDEAHYIKNPKAKRSKAVYAVGDKSKYITYMSGTPLENRIEEMVQLISKLQNPIAIGLNNNLSEYNIRPKTFRKKVAPVYLRRNRKDVLAELPDLIETEHWIPFGPSELSHYKEGIQEGNFMKMRRSAWTGGSVSESPKLNALVDICEQAKDEGHKILIFSFFRDVISVIDKTLKDRSFGPITGDINSLKRQEVIDDFDKAEAGSVLISQIMAGGVGLNIQAANIIIICEPQYKPSTEQQAISRSYRMGQNKDVIVYRLLTEESVDDRILSILHDKKVIFNKFAKESDVADQSSSAVDTSDKNTIKQIVQLEAERYGLADKNIK